MKFIAAMRTPARLVLSALLMAASLSTASALDVAYHGGLYRDVQIYRSTPETISCRSQDGNFTIRRAEAPPALIAKEAEIERFRAIQLAREQRLLAERRERARIAQNAAPSAPEGQESKGGKWIDKAGRGKGESEESAEGRLEHENLHRSFLQMALIAGAGACAIFVLFKVLRSG